MKKDIKLCLSGSGTLFYYHIGAYIRLQEQFNITDIVGTSGGAIVGSLIALYKESKEIIKIIENIDLSSLLDFNFNPLDFDGLICGDKILEQFKKYFNYQFKDIRCNLNIITTQVKDLSEFVFNHKNTPDIYLYDSLRATMSLGAIFEPHIINKNAFIDGGYVNNTAHDFWGIDENVYTIKIKDKNIYTITNILNAVEISLLTGIKANELKHKEDNPKGHYIEILNSENFLNFSFTKKEIEQMIKKGYQAVNNYLEVNKCQN